MHQVVLQRNSLIAQPASSVKKLPQENILRRLLFQAFLIY